MQKIFKYQNSLTTFIELLIIKYLYIYSTLLILSSIWYPGSGGYRIDFNLQKEIVASIVFIAITIIYLRRKTDDTMMKYLAYFLYVLYYIPINSAYSINNMPFEYLALSNLYFLFVILCFTESKHFRIKGVYRNRRLEVRDNSRIINSKKMEYILAIVCILFIAYKISYNGFRFNLSFADEDVYSTRNEYTEFRSNIAGSLWSYFFAIFNGISGIAAPLLLYISLNKRMIPGVVLSVFCILCKFAISSGKGSIIFVIIVFAINYLHKKRMDKYIVKVFNTGIILFLLISVLSKLLYNSRIIYTLIIRREMYVPAWLSTLYYDFFHEGPKMWFSDSAFLLQRIMRNPYSTPMLSLINKKYFAGYMPSPNTGLLAEAYMQMGWLGIFVYPVILALIMRFSSRVYRSYGGGLPILMAARAAISLTNIPVLRTDFVLSFILVTLLFKFAPMFKIRTGHIRLG